MEGMDMADEAALNQALSDLSVAVQAILDKLANVPDAPDLTDEVAQIQNLTDAIKQAVTPAEPPVEPPVE
jgi:hypothetical protein